MIFEIFSKKHKEPLIADLSWQINFFLSARLDPLTWSHVQSDPQAVSWLHILFVLSVIGREHAGGEAPCRPCL